MKRDPIKNLVQWKKKIKRKPLIIRGARQVGKTWIMKTFGKDHFEQVAYINFESNQTLSRLFDQDFNIEKLVLSLEIEVGFKIHPQNTLIIFDEIQEAPGALTSLKYFYENAPEYFIVAAGSLLGVALNRTTSFPVGKVEFLDLYPLSYTEFLNAMGQEALVNLLYQQDWHLINSFGSKYIESLRQYYFIGGMPEVVDHFSQHANYNEARKIQIDILNAYEQDFSKHAPNDIVPRIRMLWNSIPSQLSKENRKFVYSIIKSGARAKDYELALSWLIDCGLVHKVSRVSKPGLPLKAYGDLKSFKLYTLDVGLLGALSNVSYKILLEQNKVLTEFKGALTEQYVLQQLKCLKEPPVYYWSAERGEAEVDFLLQSDQEIHPLEVKAEENLQAKSLKVFNDRYDPNKSIRTSMSNYRADDWLINIPLFAISQVYNI